jgi:hypothetical protein
MWRITVLEDRDGERQEGGLKGMKSKKTDKKDKGRKTAGYV